jgi:hypothetical protein
VLYADSTDDDAFDIREALLYTGPQVSFNGVGRSYNNQIISKL